MKDMPSLLMIGNFLSQTRGVRAVCEDLADKLTEAGWRIRRTSTRPDRIPRLVDMLWTAWTCRNHYEVALIDTFSNWAFVWAEMVAFALRILGKKYVLILHGGGLPDFARKQPGRVARLLDSAAAVVAPSAYLFEKMKPYRADLILIPNPIDLANYPFRQRAQVAPKLVWLRAFHSIYNAPLAISAAASLAKRHPELHLSMAGDDRGDGSLEKAKQLADAHGISDRVKFPGRIPKSEIPAWLQRGDIFLNTTNVDNTPVSVMEAMACGLPVVSTNVGGIPYLLENEKEALLVSPGNCDAMATAVSRLLTEPGLAACLAKNARKKVEHFAWPHVLPAWQRLIAQVLETGAGPHG